MNRNTNRLKAHLHASCGLGTLSGRLLATALPAALLVAAGAPSASSLNRRHQSQDSRDQSVAPGADFFLYSSGEWLDRAVISPDEPAASAVTIAHDRVEVQLRSLLQDQHAGSSTAANKLRQLYASWMNEAAIEAQAGLPLARYLDRVSAVHDRQQLLRLFADPSYGGPFELGISPDPADPARYTVIVSQGGLGMPSRDYYLRDGDKYAAIRTAYRHFVRELMGRAGLPNSEARADAVITLEAEIAKAHWDPGRSRDIRQAYNPMGVDQLQRLAPQFDWPALLRAAGINTSQAVVVRQTTAIEVAGKLVDSQPLETWKDYLAYQFIRKHAQYLPREFDQASFSFFGTTLRDVPQQRERWKRGIDFVNAAMGDTLGEIYASRYFQPAKQQLVGELVGNIRAAFAQGIGAASWMDAATRRQALAKLAALDVQIGRPADFPDTSSLVVRSDDLLGNAVRAEQFRWRTQIKRLGQPVERGQWTSTPQTVNARYNVLLNQITLPAAVLQPPIFDPAMDAAFNYGSIGSLIGHEISHGFDDQGRRFDEGGKLRDWWSPTAAAGFEKRALELVRQYDAYDALPGLKVNGRLTLGENIGDLGGLEIAYSAYRRYVAAHGEPRLINGLTGDQRFFLGFASVWRAKARPGLVRQLALTDPHSPPQFRINGAVRNFDPWYKAFKVKSSDPLYLPPERRVRIW